MNETLVWGSIILLGVLFFLWMRWTAHDGQVTGEKATVGALLVLAGICFSMFLY